MPIPILLEITACQRCGASKATHTVVMVEDGSLVSAQFLVCEPCGLDIRAQAWKQVQADREEPKRHARH